MDAVCETARFYAVNQPSNLVIGVASEHSAPNSIQTIRAINLLRAIAGLDIHSSGRILQAGRDISALPPAERDFGIVFQSYALFPNLSIEHFRVLELGPQHPELTEGRCGEGYEDPRVRYP